MESEKIKILAIDDNKDNLTSLKALINEFFPEALFFLADNGKKGIELAKSENPDVILLDIIMPEMDGHEVCKKLKANKKLRDIPVVFVTANKDTKENRILALECGGEAFLTKPIDEIELTAQIRAMLKIRNANIQKRDEKEKLTKLVAEKTRELEKNYISTLNLLEDLKKEVHERQQIENVFKESEAKYRALFEGVTEAIFFFDPETFEIFNANEATSKIYGYDRKELIGMSCLKFSAEAEKSKIVATKTRKDGYVTVNYRHHKKKDGSDLYVNLSAHKVWVNGQDMFFSVCRDVTEHKQAEERVKRLSRIFENSLNEIYLFNSETLKFIEINNAAQQNLGYTMEELVTMTPLNIKPEFTLESFEKLITPLRKGKKGKIYFETVHQRKDKSLYIVEAHLQLLKFEQDEIFSAIILDITDRKKAEKALQESEELNRSITQTASDAIISINSDGIIMTWNESSEKIFGYSSEEMINNDLSKIIPEQYFAGHNAGLKKLKEGGAEKLIGKTIEMSALRKNGTEFPIELALSRWRIDSKINYTGIIRDITKRKKNEQDLIRAKEKAEKSDYLKTAFINNISHEVRTPLNGILGFAPFIIQPDTSFEEKEMYLNILNISSLRLMNTITNYMDISLIYSGNLEVHPEQVDISLTMGEVYAQFQKQSLEKNLKLKMNLPTDAIELILITDGSLLRKILTHLVDNAIKFTESGSIELGYDLKNDREKPEIELFIKDTGQGISTDAQSGSFDAFMQENIENTRGHEGSGLGLSIAKGLVEILGGKIRLESEQNQGTKVFVTLPLDKCHLPKHEKVDFTKNSIEKSGTILVAEDDELNLFFLEKVLKGHLNKLLTAKNGQEAVDLCHKHPEIGLVLMDIKMPVMNGMEATRQIKSFRKDLPIIAVTAFAQSGDEHRFKESGCDDYISKPVNKEKLLGLIKKYIKIG